MIKDNLISVQRRIDSALKKSGRKSDSCTLIGVTKTKPLSLIREAFDLGLRDFGENYVEEFVSKYREYKPVSYTHLTLPTILRV